MTVPHDRSDERLDAALRVADPNALRMALYEVTRDEELARMEARAVPVRGGAYAVYQLDAAHHDRVREIAAAVLDPDAEPRRPEAPTVEDVARMVQMYRGEAPSAQLAEMVAEELAPAVFSRQVDWSTPEPPARQEDLHVAVIGGGISGLAMARQLGRLGIPHTIIERSDGLGGTWHLARYPEARVDVSNLLYSFAADDDYPWTEHYPQAENIRKYLHHVVSAEGAAPTVLYEREVTAATWDDGRSRWTLQLTGADGAMSELDAHVLVSASGIFSTPKIPDVPGMEDFAGRIVHPMHWTDDVDVCDKRVVLVGTGSSGTQMLRHLAREARSVAVLERTPQWRTGVPEYRDELTEEDRWLYANVPQYRRWLRVGAYLTTLTLEPTQIIDPEWQRSGGRISEANDGLRGHVVEYVTGLMVNKPELVEQLLPDYAPLGRRLVRDNDFYASLDQPHVRLLPEGMASFTSDGLVTASGVHVKADVVVMATGFEVERYFFPVRYQGRGGSSIPEVWGGDGARAHLGLAVKGMPNFFCLYGPNGQPRAGSFHSWVELWVRYVTEVIVHMVEHGYDSATVKDESFDEYNRALDAAVRGIVWESEGVTGYFVNSHGRSQVNIPWESVDYYGMIRSADPAHFDFR